MRTYADFDLRISAAGDDLLITLLNSPAGESEESGPVPLTPDQLDHLRQSIDPTSPRFDPSGRELERLGETLYRGVFPASIKTMLLLSLVRLPPDVGLRIRIRMDAATERRDLPWEAMYFSDQHRFLAMSERTPVVRHTVIAAPAVLPATVRPPLRVLVIVASPNDLPALSVEREWRQIHQSFRPLLDTKQAILDRPAMGSREDLVRALSQHAYHALHFVGHGSDQGPHGDAVLHLESRTTGASEPISGKELGNLLVDHQSMRLVVLNSCLGAGGGRADMTGMAGALVRTGVPAVVAMQQRITDGAAERFASEFYTNVVRGEPVDAALSKTRNRMYGLGWRAEWSTPALYMRSRAGLVLAPPATKVASATGGAGRPRAAASVGAARSIGVRPPPRPLWWIALNEPSALATLFGGIVIGVLWSVFFPRAFRQSDAPVNLRIPVIGLPVYLYELMTYLTLLPLYLAICGRWPLRSVAALTGALFISIPTTIFVNGDKQDFLPTFGGWFAALAVLMPLGYLGRPIGRRITALRRRRKRV